MPGLFMVGGSGPTRMAVLSTPDNCPVFSGTGKRVEVSCSDEFQPEPWQRGGEHFQRRRFENDRGRWLSFIATDNGSVFGGRATLVPRGSVIERV